MESGLFERYYKNIDKLAKEFCFHDSIVTAVEYDPASYRVIVSVDLCNWAQEGYTDSEPETLMIYLEFYHAFLDMPESIKITENTGGIYRVEVIDSRTLLFIVESDNDDNPVGMFTITTDYLFTRSAHPTPRDTYNIVLAESEHYAVLREYEGCELIFKNKKLPSVCIGDFYGDPDFALIDSSEKFVLMGGFGIIIYMLREPYEHYRYNYKTEQWIEIGREHGQYFTDATQVGPQTVRITDADGNQFEYQILKL